MMRKVAAVVDRQIVAFELGVLAEVVRPRPHGRRPARLRLHRLRRAARAGADHVRVRVQVENGLDAVADVDLVAVPSWTERPVPPPPEIAEALRAALDRGARLLAVCSGAFLLAASGVLDGRRATTHWRYTATLAGRYPKIDVDPDVLYVEDGRVVTSAGTAAAIDACLHLIPGRVRLRRRQRVRAALWSSRRTGPAVRRSSSRPRCRPPGTTTSPRSSRGCRATSPSR
jgi:transcriptional regulator GlxA family with amidase domain